MVRNVLQQRDAQVEQTETLLRAAVQIEDTVFRQKVPAKVLKRTGVGIAAVGADPNLRMLGLPDDLELVAECILDRLSEVAYLIGQLDRHEEPSRVHWPAPDEIGVDVEEKAPADGQARLHQHPRLEGKIVTCSSDVGATASYTGSVACRSSKRSCRNIARNTTKKDRYRRKAGMMLMGPTKQNGHGGENS